jgi:D-tyrosyl-tRNA(Tyr) deacylase
MRVVLQRVEKAKLIVDNEVLNEIKHGYLLLVSFTHTDNEDNVYKMAKKINGLRVFEDENDKLNLSIHDVKGSILSISQFTLYGNTTKGNRPSFVDSMKFDEAKVLYDLFNKVLNEEYKIETKEGSFGNHMKLDFINDGPVTILLEN